MTKYIFYIFYIPNARKLPLWKSSKSCNKACSIRRTSGTSDKKQWCLHGAIALFYDTKTQRKNIIKT